MTELGFSNAMLLNLTVNVFLTTRLCCLFFVTDICIYGDGMLRLQYGDGLQEVEELTKKTSAN